MDMVRRRQAVVFATVAVGGVVALIATSMLVTYVVSTHLGANADLFGRLVNLQTLRQTGNIYFPFGFEAFTYPPGAILLFWPILWIPQGVLPLVWTLLAVSCLAAAMTAAVSYFFGLRHLVAFGAGSWLAVVCAFVFPPIMEDLTWGQVGTVLFLLLVLDELKVRGSWQGVMVGLATAFKVYPGLFIVSWLLRRQWRPAITAIVTMAGATIVAWRLFPRSASEFVTTQLLGGQELSHFTNYIAMTASSSVVAFFMRPPFHPGALNDVETLALAIAVAVAGLAGSQRLFRRECTLSATVVLLVTSVIAAPVAWDHYFVFAPLLLLVPLEAGWRSTFSRVCLLAAAVMAFPWFHFRRPPTGPWWVSTYAFGARNALLFAGVAIVAAAFIGEPVRTVPRYNVWPLSGSVESPPPPFSLRRSSLS